MLLLPTHNVDLTSQTGVLSLNLMKSIVLGSEARTEARLSLRKVSQMSQLGSLYIQGIREERVLTKDGDKTVAFEVTKGKGVVCKFPTPPLVVEVFSPLQGESFDKPLQV